jgi:hypothetical protein
LEVVVERLVGVYGKRSRNELVFAFTCRVVGGSLVKTCEADEHRYFAPDALPANILRKHEERIWDALHVYEQPVFRLQVDRAKGG